MQSSPEGPRGRNLPYSNPPTPLQLPEPTFVAPASPAQSAMSEVVGLGKGPSLMRRLSRGAANRTNKVMRRRPSSNHVSNRERSSGPVIRRRSESKSSADADTGVFEPSVGDYEEENDTFEDLQRISGLGLMGDGITSENGGSVAAESRTQGGIAPIVPSELRRGLTLNKVTKKKNKCLTFTLDTDSAKVSWHPTDVSKRFYIDDIQKIRLQKEARHYREEYQICAGSEPYWFTIIYADRDRAKGRPSKSIHLIAPNQHEFELWTSTLNDLSKYRHDLMVGLVGSGQHEEILRGHWRREMTKIFGERPHQEDEECLDFGGVKSLCTSLHIHASENLIRAQFDKADSTGTAKLSFHNFKEFHRRLKRRMDIKEIYTIITADHAEGLDLQQFLGFLQHTQHIDVEANRAKWVETFTKFVGKAELKSTNASPMPPSMLNKTLTRMSFEAFSSFLCSEDNNMQIDKASETRFTRPLNEYFISSSHNTYLLGRQVAGSSSTEAYIRALQHACRCVEIDCWDGPEGRPVVMHGRTMTKSVPFQDCISVIRKYAFIASPYPLVLSLEVHCNAEQQQIMVDIMVKEFGDRLIREPYMTNVLTLPSPEDLKYKILAKVKAGVDPNPNRDTPKGLRQRSFSSPFSRPQVLDNSVIPHAPLLSSPPSMSIVEGSATWATTRGSLTTASLSSATDDSDVAPGGNARARRQPKKQKSKIIKSLGDLGVYTRGLKYRDFTLPESKAYNHVFSLSERKFEDLCRNQEKKEQLEKHNMRYLMRIYPSGIRMRSTNFDPLAFWRRGAQMVALNWQTYDLGMQMNQAMFASGSDRYGYVLKPQELRQSYTRSVEEHTWEDTLPGANKSRKKLIRFAVDLISAQQLPLPRGVKPEETLDPYVEIEMFCAEDKAAGVASGEGGQDASASKGMSGIGSPHKRRSIVVQSNGYNPIFNDNFRLSLETKYPSLVFVRWTVWNSQDGHNYNGKDSTDPLATFTAKLSSLEQGYRHLPLYDHNGEQFLFATLFCRIQKEEPITIERDDPIAAEKVGLFGRFGQSFKRTLSTDKKAPRELKAKASRELNGKSSKEKISRKSSTDGKSPPIEATPKTSSEPNGRVTNGA